MGPAGLIGGGGSVAVAVTSAADGSGSHLCRPRALMPVAVPGGRRALLEG